MTARTAALLATQVEVRELEKAQAESHAQRQALEAEVARLQRENAGRDAALAQARADFAQELQKLRDDAHRSEERLRASEKRALLEIDRERGNAAKPQKELDEAAHRADRKDADHRRAVDTMQSQLGDARHQTGVLQGRLDAVQAENTRLQTEVIALRDAQARARDAHRSPVPATVRNAPRATRPSRAAVAAKPGTRRKKAV
ncbi:hypothetical protein [Paraburkholderia sp. WC7.3g]|uniref:hypothetical protein n=1 Tax=Paraburkholderia sp. WC7.3g TaxID=2991070 RepID=UPI003D1E341B